jgi:hypothetical protein
VAPHGCPLWAKSLLFGYAVSANDKLQVILGQGVTSRHFQLVSRQHPSAGNTSPAEGLPEEMSAAGGREQDSASVGSQQVLPQHP